MNIKLDYEFLQEVRTLLNDDVMIVTFIQVAADGTIVYGCLTYSGETKWYKSYELMQVQPASKILFNKVSSE